MTQTICLVNADVTHLRLLTPGREQEWRAPDLETIDPDSSQIDSLAEVTARLAGAAVWLADAISPNNRIGAICVGVEQAGCVWITAPSADSNVISAALRKRDQEWGDAGVVGSAQALAEAPPARKMEFTLLPKRSPRVEQDAAKSTDPIHQTVLRLEDGAVSLWLDELDRRNIRVDTVLSLWHAAAQAWTTPSASASNGAAPLEAILLIDEAGQAIWCWAQAQSLLAAGRFHLPPAARDSAHAGPEDDTPDDARAEAGRLALDWLTWSAQLGDQPQRILLVADNINRFAAELKRAWPAAKIDARAIHDPVGATLFALAKSENLARTAESPARSVTSLSTRPGRSHRRLFHWAAAAIFVLAFAAAAFGVRSFARASELRAESRAFKSEIKSKLEAVDPALARDPRPERALQSRLIRIRQQNPDLVAPPSPKPLLDEFVRLATQIQKLQETDGAITRFQISSDSGFALLNLKAFEPAEEIRSNLEQDTGSLQWRGRIEGSTPNLTLRLSGDWIDEQ